MPKDSPQAREKTQRKRFDETKRIPKLSRPRAPVNPENRTDKCWFYVTMDNIKNVVDDVLAQGKDIRIITAESAYCSMFSSNIVLIMIWPLAPVCHSDFSKANIDAPNGLLGHCRRVKKCLKEKERRNIVTLGLKMRRSSNTKGNPTFWDSVDSLRMMDEFPLKAYYLDRVMPESLKERHPFGLPPERTTSAPTRAQGTITKQAKVKYLTLRMTKASNSTTPRTWIMKSPELRPKPEVVRRTSSCLFTITNRSQAPPVLVISR
ncbi:hypothetical protein FRC00_008721 [Tulasnella sp. 408]|nr:hypothetical protein FRC00_008721 [Tulasnella sp. 408]